MLSILLCHSYFLRLDQKQLDRAKPYPPLATLQVAGLLRARGHRVALFDAMLAESVEEYRAMLRQIRPQIVVIYEDNYNFLSKMCLSVMRRAACSMIAAARSAGARSIAAGSDASDAPEPYLIAGADAVLIGEGLTSLVAIVARLDEVPERPASELAFDLQDVAWSGRPNVASNRGRRRSLAPALQPGPPTWDLVDIERYRAIWRGAHGHFSLNMAASRGCSFRCAWCAKPIWGNRYLQRDAVEVAAEMTHLKRTYAPDHVWFADDIFGFRADWVDRFATAVNAEDGGIPFTIQSRADLLSARMAAALEEAGCCEVWIGAESGSQRVLDAMNKGVAVEEIRAARERLGAHGIRVGFFIQLGYLGEELEDLIATRELIATARPDDIGVSVAYPLPGTAFHALVKAQLGKKTRWRESDDLAMMFRGTFTSEFYRTVRDLLHEEVELQQRKGDTGLEPVTQALSGLDARWADLTARAHEYRNAPETSPGQCGRGLTGTTL